MVDISLIFIHTFLGNIVNDLIYNIYNKIPMGHLEANRSIAATEEVIAGFSCLQNSNILVAETPLCVGFRTANQPNTPQRLHSSPRIN